MGWPKLFLRPTASLILVSLFCPAVVQAQSNPASDQRALLLDNVVRVVVAGQPSGYGFVVGRNGDVLWVATAAHVVFQEEDETAGATEDARSALRGEIRVVLRGGNTEWQLAGLPQQAVGADLAFLPVQIPLSKIFFDSWLRRVVEQDPEPGGPVRIAAVPSGIEFDAWVGTIVREGNSIRVESLAGGREGQSGAPVVGGRAFIGMYLGSAGQRILPMDVIEKAARQADLPWSLEVQPPRSTTVRLCLDVRGVLPSEVRINSPAGVSQLDESGCAPASSGRTAIYVDGRVIENRCVPDRVNLPSIAEQRLSVDCSLDPQGAWSSPYGQVRVTKAGSDRWRIRGLDFSPFGEIDGEMWQVGDLFQVQARNGMAQQVIGELRKVERRLSGFLVGGGQRVDLELTR